MNLKLPVLPPLDGPSWREFTLLAVLLSAVLVASYKPPVDPDTFWHLAVGREIWQTGHLVGTETFSFTAAGTPWEDTEWLFHVILYPAWNALGETGLSLLAAAVATLAVGLAYRSVRLMGGDAMGYTLFVCAMMPAFQARVSVRPDLISMIFMALLMESLLRWRPQEEARDRFWMFTAPLFWFWCQFHGGWAYGFALLGMSAFGDALDAWRCGTIHRMLLWRLIAPLGAPALAIFVNPFGWRIPCFPFKTLFSFADAMLPTIAEWQHTPWSRYTALVVALLIVSALAQFWPPRPCFFRDVVWCSSQAGMGLYWARYAGFSTLTLAPFTCGVSGRLLKGSRLRRAGWTIAFLAALGTGVAYQTLRMSHAQALKAFPAQEAHFMVEEGVSGKILHDYGVGGYLEWVAPRSLLTLFDGRFFPFIEASKAYRTSMVSTQTYESFLSRFGFDIVLFPHPAYRLRDPSAPGGPPRGPSARLFPKDSWALVFFGDYGMVFLRRTPANARVIAEKEYKVLRPDDLDYLTKAAREGKADTAALRSEIARRLKGLEPGPLRAPLERALSRLEELRSKAR